MAESKRLARVLGALSIATDLGAGLTQGTAMCTAVLAVRVGRKLNLPNDDLIAIYYGAMLRFIGCTSNSTEVASMGCGEDGQLLHSLGMCDWTNQEDLEHALNKYFHPAVSDEVREESIAAISEGYEGIKDATPPHCEQAMLLISRLPLPPSVVEVVRYMYNRWDDKYPGLSGTDVPVAARIVTLAASCELFRRAGGVPSVIDMLKQRSGGQFDPDLCHLISEEANNLFSDYGQLSEWEMFLATEPEPPLEVLPEQRIEVARCFADYVDQKSGWFHGHSRQVASLALLTAKETGLDQDECQRVYIGGLLHDIGRAAVPNRVWEKPDELNSMERREAERHSYQTELILAEAGIFDDVIEIAESVHERQDSSGYHRRGHLTSKAAACVATADIYNALVNPRPWRKAMSSENAAEVLIKEVQEGRLPAETVQGLLKAVGQTSSMEKRIYPAGLTRREIDVLSCLIRGLSNKEISADLNISPKTAENHLTRIYDKTNTNGRSQAAIFALKHRIFAD